MPESKSENNALAAIVLVLIIFASFLMLGFTGARTILGIIILMFLPFYLIFSNFSLSQGEKIIFSFFVSIAIYPSLAYWLGFAVPFRISVLIVFAVLLISAFLIKKFKRQPTLSN